MAFITAKEAVDAWIIQPNPLRNSRQLPITHVRRDLAGIRSACICHERFGWAGRQGKHRSRGWPARTGTCCCCILVGLRMSFWRWQVFGGCVGTYLLAAGSVPQVWPGGAAIGKGRVSVLGQCFSYNSLLSNSIKWSFSSFFFFLFFFILSVRKRYICQWTPMKALLVFLGYLL